MVATVEMQSISSLIGAGTALAAAATGLAFGQPPGCEQQNTTRNSSLTKQTSQSDRDLSGTYFPSRARTNSTASTALPPVSAQPHTPGQIVPPRLQTTTPVNATSAQTQRPRRGSHAQIMPAQRHSLLKQGDNSTPAPMSEDSRDSMSSSGSWMRRLSIRPLSQHGSLRSSIGPDSPSLFSFGSGTPILSTPRDTPQLPPNKLVKRTPTMNINDAGLSKRRGSRTQISLRRPATSHQRSATLQHQLTAKELPPPPETPTDHQKRPRAKTVGAQQQRPILGGAKDERSRWKSFWHAKLSQTISRATSSRGTDSTGQPMGRKDGIDTPSPQEVYLVTPSKLIMNGSLPPSNGFHPKSDHRSRTVQNSPQGSSRDSENGSDATENERRKRPTSIQLSSPTSWLGRAGSLRRSKRTSETPGSDKRRLSAPVAGDAAPIRNSQSNNPANMKESTEFSQAAVDLTAIFRPPGKPRGLPPSPRPLSPLSSLNPDTDCLDSPSLAPPGGLDETISSVTVSSRVNSQGSYTRTLERASTVGSSEYQRGFTSGDDDDTDFKTDTPFDSFRTVASGRKQGLDSPLESMFDDSPLSAQGNTSKPKRLSIQDILGPSFDGGDKIMEEDETGSSPVRGSYEEFEVRFREASIQDNSKPVQGLMPQDSPQDKDQSPLTLDDDEDDDDLGWAREDDKEFYNGLSPPGSMNSRRGNAVFNTGVGGAGSNAKREFPSDSASERPRSTIFDWTEPQIHDRRGKNGLTYRPKTVHGKQEIDLRGGRSASRKGPVAAHVRSQSVPLVPDLAETSKSAPKFGTWGLGQKNVSEEWDDDFEFEEDVGSPMGPVENGRGDRTPMIVPASIQATQPTVRAHSGQIRELSLLVNDLKRLCRLGREMGMLLGSSSRLWHEAEGIIALASPDEDTDAVDGCTADDFNSSFSDERFTAQGFDGASLETPKSLGPQNPLSRRQSVFQPDDVFGTSGNTEERVVVNRPMTPENATVELRSTSVAKSVMESMRKRVTVSDAYDAYENHEVNKPPKGKLNFDTNSLKELVKHAGDLRDSLSELIRREDPITQSPARTPKRARANGSPAFTRVFDEPMSSPTRHNPHNHKTTLGGTPINASPSNKMSRRMQVMTVN
ncbi:hypothetical protein GGR50DRAFT_141779 [Xylaria sp. CBS 124048]|nr:hypothetical protein GGR50DRAFT_141779 [Xylaria sp. CBS 124048]